MLRLFSIALLAAVFVEAKKDKEDKKPKKEKPGKSEAWDEKFNTEFLEWAAKNNKSYKDSENMNAHKMKYKKYKKEVEQLNQKKSKA